MRLLALNLAKIAANLVKLLRLGNASALPGRIALFFDSQILEKFALEFSDSLFGYFVTGTNGKTTSTGLLKSILVNKLKSSVICNEMGANLYYGICAEFVRSSDFWGKPLSKAYALELDEAAFVKVSSKLKPRCIAVTNIFRDQLDRFGELDSTQKLIEQGINNALSDNPEKLKLILNLDDSRLASLNIDSRLEIHYFSVINKKIEDCDAGLQSNRDADFKIEIIQLEKSFSEIKILVDDKSILVRINLPGLYNIYNAATAAASAYYSGIDLACIKEGLENYNSVFGRSESKISKGIKYQVFLIKNPTGATEVLKHISNLPSQFLIIINDNYADGKDISWLWDAKFEYLVNNGRKFYCSGHRAYDMALRLKYAGVEESKIQIIPKIKDAMKIFLQKTDLESYVLPTYTALLELERL